MNIWISTYERFGIPETLAASVAGFLLLFIVSGYIVKSNNIKFGELEFSVENNRYWLLISRIISPILLIISIIAFYPHWANPNVFFAKTPRCIISADWIGSDKYVISWFVDSETPTLTKVNGFEVELRDKAEYTFSPKYDYMRFTLYAESRWGTCGNQIVLNWDDINRPLGKMSCNISVDIDMVEIGEEYKVSWSVGGASKIVTFINGSEVDEIGQGTFIFTGPNYDRFRLVSNDTIGGTCESEVVIVGMG